MAYLRSRKKAKSTAPINKKNPRVNLKEKIAEQRKKREKTAKFIGFMSIAILLGFVLGLPLAIAVSPKIGIGAFLAVTIMLFSYQYPRTALWAFLIYMPFAGTVTYWIASGSVLFQVAKDAFYFPALLALIVDCRRKGKPIFVEKKLLPSLAFLVVVAVITLLVVNGGQQVLPSCSYLKALDLDGDCKNGVPFMQGVLGLKVLLGYIPLIFCAYYLIEDKKQLLFLGRLLAVLAVICCLLGLVQYWYLKTGRCAATSDLGATGAELYKASLDAKCLVGGSVLYSPEYGVIRLPGTFVSPWHWAWFLIANSAITFTVAFFETSFLWRLISFTGMGLVFINAVISGQRIALGLVPVVTVIMLVLTGQIVNLKRFLPIAVGLGIALIGFISLNPEFIQERIDSFVARWNTSPPHLFIAQQFDWAVRNYPHYNTAGILGAGLGKATGSTRVFGEINLIETFHPKLIFEIGYIGLFAFMIFITHLNIYAFKKNRLLRDPVLRSFASAFWVFMLIIGYFPYWYPLDTDPVAVYYWLFAGVLIRLPVIDKQERQKEIEGIVHENKIKSKSFTRLTKRKRPQIT
jgi:hypothetical protein